MLNIAICICTRKRQEGLYRLLDSIQNIEIPNGIKIYLVIIENDTKNLSEDIVNKFSSTSKFRVNYFLETKQGLSYARNRAVKEAGRCDFCCFFDDDQIIKKDCLIELLKCQAEFDADAVSGYCPPLFSKDMPSYVEYFHTRKIKPYGAILKYAGTGCLMIKKELLDSIEGPFDLRLNFSGSEDIYLTYNISKVGGIIRSNPYAIAYENIEASRTTLKYIIKRSYGDANASYFLQSLMNHEFSKPKTILRLILRLGYGLLIVIPFLLFGKSKKIEGLIKITKALGGFSFILGQSNQFYK